MVKRGGLQFGILVLLLAVLMFGCASNEFTINKVPASQERDDRIRVVATSYPLYDFSTHIGGKYADVYLMTGDNIEYDILHLFGYEYFLYVGEYWTGDLHDDLQNHGFAVMWVSEYDNVINDAEFIERNRGVYAYLGDNTDYWLDFELDKKVVGKIADALAMKMPANADYFYNNAEAYKQKLDVIDLAYKKGLGSCSSTARSHLLDKGVDVVISDYASNKYLGRDFISIVYENIDNIAVGLEC